MVEVDTTFADALELQKRHKAEGTGHIETGSCVNSHSRAPARLILELSFCIVTSKLEKIKALTTEHVKKAKSLQKKYKPLIQKLQVVEEEEKKGAQQGMSHRALSRLLVAAHDAHLCLRIDPAEAPGRHLPRVYDAECRSWPQCSVVVCRRLQVVRICPDRSSCNRSHVCETSQGCHGNASGCREYEAQAHGSGRVNTSSIKRSSRF